MAASLSISSGRDLYRSADGFDRFLRYLIVRGLAEGATHIRLGHEDGETKLSFHGDNGTSQFPKPPLHFVDGVAKALLRYRPFTARMAAWWKDPRRLESLIVAGEIDLRIATNRDLIRYEIFPTPFGKLVGLTLPVGSKLSESAIQILADYDQYGSDVLCDGEGLLTA